MASFQGFRSVVENGPNAISVINTHGEILYGSSSNSNLFGYKPAELVGRNCLELVHPEDRDHARSVLKQALTKPPCPLRWNARIRRKDGNYSWVESTVSNLISDSDVQAIVVHQRDINGQKAAEEKTLQHAEELKRSNLRLEEFAYTAAHDLREPLRAISSFTEMLTKRLQMDAESKELAQFVVDGAARMAVLIDDLLLFAKTGIREPPRSVNLQHAVAEAIRNLALELETNRPIVKFDQLPIVRSNETQLVRLAQNLISNAVKYRSQRPLQIQVTADRRGSDWVVKVQDNGIGIALEDQTRIFMPFIRLANRDMPGTGLGLTVCRKIVEGLGGTIWVESEIGVGSTFAFTIVADEGTTVPDQLFDQR
jgi:PAS domain S-box-containing protein